MNNFISAASKIPNMNCYVFSVKTVGADQQS